MAFYAEMQEAEERLRACGHEVVIPRLALEVPESYAGGGNTVYFGQYIEEQGGIDAFPAGHELWDLKEGAIRDHYRKIEWGEAILVVNHEKRGVNGYIGGNTLIEIGVAFYLQKPIFLLHPVSSDLSYKQEIMGMKPVVLEGDLEKIKA